MSAVNLRSWQGRRVIGSVTAVLLFGGTLYGHGDDGAGADRSWWWQWSSEPGMVVMLVSAAWVYWRGLRRLRSVTRAPRKLRREAWCYAGGWLAFALAVVSPLHPISQILFSAHMTQHEILMLVAAPLLVLGRPTLSFLWAMDRGQARRLVRWGDVPVLKTTWQTLTQPFIAWMIHALALWIWHVPAFFEATLEHPAVHHFQHACFFGSALLFWHSIFRGRRRAVGFGVGVLYLFTTAVHSGALGALITFAGGVLYPHYETTTAVAGLTALQDQQLGGLIMWIPAGLVYVAAALAMFAGWLRRSEASLSASRSLAPVPETGSWSGR
jgi:putative membrane protein